MEGNVIDEHVEECENETWAIEDTIIYTLRMVNLSGPFRHVKLDESIYWILKFLGRFNDIMLNMIAKPNKMVSNQVFLSGTDPKRIDEP